MVKTQKLFDNFVDGDTEGKANSVFIDGHAIYSYGYHLPLAVRAQGADGVEYYVNSDKYSVTTSKHQSWLRGALSGHTVHFRDTATIRKVAGDIHNPEYKSTGYIHN